MFNRDFSTEGANPRIHKKELPDHGLLIINSTDATYENDVNEWLQGEDEAFHGLATTLKPFSVLVKNTNNKDILAYKLNWELKMSDGTVVNYPRTRFSPDYLTGTPRSDLYDRWMDSIKKNSKRFFTMIPTPLETQAGTSGTFATRIEPEEVDRFQVAPWSNDMNPFVSKITEQLHKSTDVTVTIESVLFDDGEFVGPAGDQQFIKLKASVTAKHDLLKEIKTAVKENNVPLSIVFDKVASIAQQEIPIPTPGARFGAYYNFFRRLQAQEIMSSRQAFGDDTKTIGIFLKRLDHKWIIPYEQGLP
jgi:hypothetical protein